MPSIKLTARNLQHLRDCTRPGGTHAYNIPRSWEKLEKAGLVTTSYPFVKPTQAGLDLLALVRKEGLTGITVKIP